jgi:hypothetical protein
VPEGRTLSVQPGVTVHFEAGWKITADGFLDATGEPENPIDLVTEETPHRGLRILRDFHLQNGGALKPG